MGQPFFLMWNLEVPEVSGAGWTALQSRIGATGADTKGGRVLVDADFHGAWAAFEGATPELAAAGCEGWVASWSIGTGDLDLLLLQRGACESGTLAMDGQPEVRLGPKRSRRRKAPELVRSIRDTWAALYRIELPGPDGLDAIWPLSPAGARGSTRKQRRG